MQLRSDIILNYLKYQAKSKHRKGHGIHSPYVYEFVSKVLFDKQFYEEYDYIAEVYNELTTSKEILKVNPLGAGSEKFQTEKRTVQDLARISSVQPRYGNLLFRIAKYSKPSTIIELGTSIGISTLCLAKGNPKARIVTIEGDTTLCEYARAMFKKHGLNTIKAINGPFDDYLPYLGKNYPLPQLIFIDGNHAYDATLRYFNFFIDRMEEGFLIIDDINWSADMRKAWNAILQDKRVTVSIDLFFMGIVIKRKLVTPGHYVIRF